MTKTVAELKSGEVFNLFLDNTQYKFVGPITREGIEEFYRSINESPFIPYDGDNFVTANRVGDDLKVFFFGEDRVEVQDEKVS